MLTDCSAGFAAKYLPNNKQSTLEPFSQLQEDSNSLFSGGHLQIWHSNSTIFKQVEKEFKHQSRLREELWHKIQSKNKHKGTSMWLNCGLGLIQDCSVTIPRVRHTIIRKRLPVGHFKTSFKQSLNEIIYAWVCLCVCVSLLQCKFQREKSSGLLLIRV